MAVNAPPDDAEGRMAKISGLKRISLVLELLTFVVVALLSPLSFVLALPFGVAPEVWLEFWLRYVVIFLVVAMLIALLGLVASSSYWVKAEHIKKGAK